MNKFKAIELLAEHHEEFISAAKSIYGSTSKVRNYAEDYVQEMYIKLLRYDDLYEKIVGKNGKVSKGYGFFALRSIILNDLKKKRNLSFNFMGDGYDMDKSMRIIDKGISAKKVKEDDFYKELLAKVEDSLGWFDALILKTYVNVSKSYNVLAEESGLGYNTVYKSIGRCKRFIKEELGPDYANFLLSIHEDENLNVNL